MRLAAAASSTALAALLGLMVLAAPPVMAQPADAGAAPSGGQEDIPAGVPTDNYGFVGWCYGALDEYLTIYTKVLPDLKDIDQLIGSPVKEDVPYAEDVELEHKALKRFAVAMEAAEKANPPLKPEGQSAITQGRGVWAQAEALPNRKLADAWLFWGVPQRCESTAKALTAHPSTATEAVAAPAAPSQ